MEAGCSRRITRMISGIKSALANMSTQRLNIGSSGASGYFRRILLFLALSASSCAVPVHSDHATTRYLIIGLGVVTVHENARDAIVATDAQSLGLSITNRPDFHISAGYLSS